MRRILAFFLLLTIAAAFISAEQGARIALVVGNAAYDGTAALKNPVNDAIDVAAALKAAGWDVTLITDADRRAFTRGIDTWGAILAESPDSNALFYYAGHGVQVDGINYLIPVKSSFESISDIKYDAVNLGDVSKAIEAANCQVSLVVLDACRDNPFAKTTRSTGNRGLTVVQSGGGTKGSAIIFSTGPGDVAQDGAGRNGVFTAALLHNIDSDMKLEDMFKKVTAEVRQTTGDQQKPWINASMGSDFYLLSDQIRQSRAAVVAASVAEAANKAAADRQAELEALEAKVRSAEASKADALKAQLAQAQKEADIAKVAQADATAKALAMAAEAQKAVADAKAAQAAADARAGKALEEARAAQDAAMRGGAITRNGSFSLDWLGAGYLVQLDGASAMLVDGKDGDKLIEDLKPGTYALSVYVPGLGTYKQDMQIANNEDLSIAKPFGFFGRSLLARQLEQRKNLASLHGVTNYGYVIGGIGLLSSIAAFNLLKSGDIPLGSALMTFGLGSATLVPLSWFVSSPNIVKLKKSIAELDRQLAELEAEDLSY